MISLIIVNYNQEHFLGKAIASVLAQTRRDWELLIWDDGSTDNSVAIAREYEQQDDRVRVIAATHQGVAEARKNAVAQTKGNYIGWVDSDDWIAKTALEETAKVLDSNRANRFYLCKKPASLIPWALPTLLTSLSLMGAIAVSPATAQQIIPNNDGTMTVITKDGNSFNIDGGTLSGDGKNLFHSFQEFGLDAGQIANFLSNPNIQNILGRINSGNPSLINGLIQVTGGNSNLFLMNPSGIIFGNNASLNVPGDFTATTATGIGFGDGWFNAVGTNDYLNLVGNPDSFNFTNAESGVIINAGDLKVADDSNISLTGGTVINTGTIETEGGNITVASVPGTNRVRISQEGQLLSLEVPIPQNANGEALPIRVVDLPNLLRGLPVNIDTGLEVAANDDVTVANSNTVIPNEPGTTIVSGTVDASNTQSGSVGGEAHLLGGKVGLIGANIDVSGTNGGGEVLIGGDYKGQGTVPNASRTFVSRDSVINADALKNGDGGRVIVWADEVTGFYGNINASGGLNSGDGGFVEVSGKESLSFDGTVDVSANNGDWGTLLLDPTNISIANSPSTGGVEASLPDIFQNEFAGTDITINAGTLQTQAGDIILEATNNITIPQGTSLNFVAGGTIEFKADADGDTNGSFQMFNGTTSGSSSLNTNGRSLTITAADVFLAPGVTGFPSIDPATIDAGTGNITFQPSTSTATIGIGENAAGDFNLDTTDLTENLNSSGTVTIGSSALTESVTINSLDLSGENYNLTVRGGPIVANGSIQTNGKDLTLNAGNAVDINQNITTNGGAIVITSGSTIDSTGATLRSLSTTDVGGDITFNAAGSIITGGQLISYGSSQGGDIRITSSNSTIDINNVLAAGATVLDPSGNPLFTTDQGGAIVLQANGDITVGEIFSVGEINDGNISITSSGGAINITGAIGVPDSPSSGNGGVIDISAAGNIVTQDISSSGLLGGGRINIISSGGIINTSGSVIDSSSAAGTGGAISLEAAENITATGSIIRSGIVDPFSDDNSAGEVVFQAAGNITTDSIFANGLLGGGNISLTSSNGTIETFVLDSSSTLGNGGEIELAAPNNITTNNISTNNNVTLTSSGNIATGYIDSGGNIRVDSNGENNNTQGLFTATETIPDTSISLRGTTVTIEHGGGNTEPRTPFIVGDATTNGTAGDIVTSENVTATTSFPDTFISTNETIQIITIDLPIVPAEDGTGSIVTAQEDGATFDITGGLTSDDNQNLFHSFIRFDLPELEQTANFVANDSLNNILARVSSGDASDIQGTIQITGGNPNLFLINPAGIIFSSDAQLNVPAAFTATTGNGVRFGNNWFSASGDFTPLNGTPDAIALTMNNPGAIINNANLTNNNGALNLVGGTVVNSGDVIANGFSAIALNEGASIVNLSDFTITSTEGVTNLPNSFTADIMTFADLIALIGEDITVNATNADDIALEIQNTINSNGQDINLIGNSNNETGVLIDSNLNADGGNITITGTSIQEDGVFIRGEVTTSGDGAINVTGTSTDSIGIETLGVDGSSNTQITTANGEINLTGTSSNSIGVNTQTTNITSTDNNVTFTGDKIDLLTGTNITGDTVTLQPETPELNIAISPTATPTTALDITQAELNTIEANSIAIGNATDSSGTITVDNSVTVDDPITLTTSGKIQVNGAIAGTDDASVTLDSSTTNLNNNITTEGNTIAINSSVSLARDVELNTTQNSSEGANITFGGNVNGANNLTLDAGSGDLNIQGTIGTTATPLGDLQANSTGTTNLGGAINAASVTTNEGGLTTLNGNITTTENQTFNDNLTTSANTELNSSNGNITTQDITTSGNDLDINANSISTGNITTQGGEVELESTEGAIATRDINSSGTTGGDVTLNSVGNISVESIKADGTNRGGNIKVNVDNDNPPLFVADSIIEGLDGNFSIFTGGTSGGEVTIKHGGARTDPRTPFQVGFGEQQNVNNGTAGAIGSRETQITDGSFIFTERRRDIGIISNDPPNGEIATVIDPPKEPPRDPVEPGSGSKFTDQPPLKIASIPDAQQKLREIEQQAAQKPALVYISFTSPEIKAGTSNPDEHFIRAENCLTAEYQEALGLTETQVEPIICLATQPSDKLEILVVTPEGEPIFVDNVTFEDEDGQTHDVTREKVETEAQELYRQITGIQKDDWEIPGEKLYEWLIGSIEEQLEAREIDNLLFVLPSKLRSLPLAALYDWEQDRVLVEKGYNIGLAPSINLMNTTYNKDVQQASVLALGASKFKEDQNQQDLNAVEVELPQIVNLRGGQEPILNEQFTLENLQNNLDRNSVPIVHLSTHANFDTKNIDDIYIQLYNRKLTLSELRSLDLQVGNSDLELLVLSACRSAFGNTDAELGFAGLAVKVGVKTAVGSLWKVSDLTTPALMIEFYNQLKTSPFKAEALRLAQVAMRNKDITIDLENRQMITSWGEVIELPENVVADSLKSYIGVININKTNLENRQMISIRGENIELPENVVAELLDSNIGTIKIDTINLENRQMVTSQGQVIELPENVVAKLLKSAEKTIDLSHPYYWAPFTVIGSPW